MNTFTEKQIRVLRNVFGMLQELTPEGQADLSAMLVRLPVEALAQLSNATPPIAWLSRAAAERLAHLEVSSRDSTAAYHEPEFGPEDFGDGCAGLHGSV